jgi:hypothetical protein
VAKKVLDAGDERTIGTLLEVLIKVVASPDVLKKTVNGAIILIKINYLHYSHHQLM